MSRTIIRTPHGGCEDIGCIRNYKGSCLYNRIKWGVCEKEENITSEETKNEEA